MAPLSESKQLSLLIVEDSEDDLDIYRRLLRCVPYRKYEIFETYSQEDALRICRERAPDCILLDFNLPGFTGLELLESMQSEFGNRHLPVVVLTGGGDTELAVRLLKSGASDYIPKDRLSSELLGLSIDSAIQKARYERTLTQREDALLKALQEARDANDAKSLFLSNISHEIRTPMNGILGLTEAVLEESIPEEIRSSLEMVSVSAGHLLNIIDDLLDFSKMDAEKLELVEESFSPYECIEDSLGICTFLATEKKLSVTSDLSPEIPHELVGDRWRLQQVLINLLGNAVKFTDRDGTIALEARVSKSSDASATLSLAVKDSGIGIPQEKLETIFTPFSQIDSRICKKFGGSGLGLSISARLVELMNGRIWVESVSGVGSTFFLEIPFAQKIRRETSSLNETKRHVIAPYKAALPALSVLVAEDNVVNRRVVRLMLEKEGHHVHLVGNGREVVKAYSQGNFDIILMDIQMPEIDGLEATSIIRKMELDTGSHIPVIALTAYAVVGEKERFLASGMDSYVTKPFKKKELFEAMAQVYS